MILVDSSIWIEALRRNGDPATKLGLDSLFQEDEAAWCEPVKLEVLGGAAAQDRQRLAFFFGAVSLVSLTGDDWAHAIRSSWMCRDKGVTIPWNDLLIASLALRNKLRVYAKDRHFDLMAGILGLSLYQPG